MKKPEITKGEWTACTGLAGERFNIETRGTGNDCEPIARLKGPDRKANATAIAALPDLLEALEDALFFLEQGMKHSDFGSAGTEVLDIKAALTKAGYTFD